MLVAAGVPGTGEHDMTSLSLSGVSKAFDKAVAVDDLSFEVPPGCIYGLLGPNGAGKTTTIRMIVDIIRPDRGTIEVLGLAPVAAKSRVGYMPEERGLYRKMTVLRTLEFFASLRGGSMPQARTAARQWLDRLGLADQAHRRAEELSKGMQQKLQLAVAAVGHQELLILDEPFAGLDPVNLDLVKGIIQDLRRDGRTIILSTHLMHEAQQLCEAILLINHGRAVFNGTLEQARAGWPSNIVAIQAESGDGKWIAGLPMVESMTGDRGQLEVRVRPGSDPQQLLAAMVGKVRIRSFQVKQPTLHEIFVQLAGASHDTSAENRLAGVR